ncbi:MAG: alpha/beta hydrolase [Balneolaceae bacterium]|nr:alpha/beta hydrolase [Balneolaceae bacterium]
MDSDIQLMAWHGWGFDHTCWRSWENILPDHIRISLFNRGYRGEQRDITFTGRSARNIVFAHSFGLHLCPPSQLARADLVVIFGGVRGMHPEAAQFNRRSKLVLGNMIEAMREDPGAVIRKFMQNCYRPDPAPEIDIQNYRFEKLRHDLQVLNECSLEVEPLTKAKKICILHGSSDKIVPKAKGRELYNLLSRHSSYFEVKGAGHALPFTHTEQCWAFIEPELRSTGTD